MSKATKSVLVVDDERDMAESCGFFLERAGFAVQLAFSALQALKVMENEQFSLVISDVKMPRMSGLALLDAIKKQDPDVEVLLITGFPEIDTAVDAIKRGAFDYLPKPFDEETLMHRVHKAMAHHRLKSKNAGLRERLRQGVQGRQMVYGSAVFQELKDSLERVAVTDASVLIMGESGTGKELLAHHLHDTSLRAGRPFVPLDCAAIPESLVESELFGHAKGAFTGAHSQKVGLFQVADGGTLFLDEVGELPLSFQPKLLRAIQERQVRPVGAHDYVHVDVRLVCATNRNLREEVQAGRFREDLFYRLDVVRLEAPPLRARSEDIPLLAEHFLQEIVGKNANCRVTGFSPAAKEALSAADWPGNVRQLRNAVERACTLGEGPLVEVGDLTQDVMHSLQSSGGDEASHSGSETFQEMKARRVAAMERSYLEGLLQECQGNVTQSAQAAGMTRSALQKLLQRYGIKSQDYRS